ncbi:MAG: SdiA-regulated domain-containing protein, partial [Ignavibacteria bacterium]|nr:SdiA-regulated domain-containing protein [Ignavibacteria bacterium]
MIHSIPKIIIISYLLLVPAGCDKIKEQPEKLKPIETYPLKISEPSGLELADGKLWIVSDRESTVYQTDLEGKEEFSFKIKEADLEGITVIDDSLLAIVKEVSREIVIIDFDGNEIFRSSLQVEGSKNSGLEGITYNPSNKHFYLVNEKDPVLLIETDKNLKEISRKKIKSIKDLSGISYSLKEDCLWLLSDEDRKIIKSSLEGEFITEYKINVEQPEGIAVDDEN